MAERHRKKKTRPGRLRIVAGIWRSRLLDIADVAGLRPTSARIRETLFNWLGPRIHGARCLDLFAGTGALGLEALSRGAGAAVFVERSVPAAKALRENIKKLGAHTADVVQMDATAYLQREGSARFDVVFLDPPFAEGMLDDICRSLDDCGVLAPGARIYIEQDRSAAEPELPAGWQVLKDKTAGNVRYMLVQTGT